MELICAMCEDLVSLHMKDVVNDHDDDESCAYRTLLLRFSVTQHRLLKEPLDGVTPGWAFGEYVLCAQRVQNRRLE
jgi:hypothetical protein